jgi:hypothetical protein
MDQPTPDQPTPAEPPAPETIPKPTPVPASPRDQRSEAHLQRLIDSGTPVVVWTRGWVSRESRAHRLLAARTFDFAVLTERDLSLFSTGFFTRRPRRIVYTAALDDVRVVEQGVPSGRRLSIRSDDQPRRLRIELNGSPRASAFADALLARVRSRKE